MHYTLYHGTKYSNALKIIEMSKFIPKNKDTHYLGQGIYFYDNPNNASRWIKGYYKGFVGAILRVEIDVDDKDVLDLRNEYHRKRAEHILKDVMQAFPFNPQHDTQETSLKKLRCFMFDSLWKTTKCKLLISSVITNTLLWIMSVPDDHDLQYCVKDDSIIKTIVFSKKVEVGYIV